MCIPLALSLLEADSVQRTCRIFVTLSASRRVTARPIKIAALLLKMRVSRLLVSNGITPSHVILELMFSAILWAVMHSGQEIYG